MLLATKGNRECKILEKQRAEYVAQGWHIVELRKPQPTIKQSRTKTAPKASVRGRETVRAPGK